MKRLVVLCVCLLLASAVPASAGIDIMGTVTEGNLTVGVTVNDSPIGTANSSNYNVVDVWLETLTGPLAGSEINSISGRWTAVGGTMKVDAAAATASAFKKQTVLTNGMGTYSGINLDNYVGTFGRDGGTTIQSSYIYADDWYCTGGDPTSEIYPGGSANSATNDNGFPASLLGEFLVTPSTTAISFSNLLDGINSVGFGYDALIPPGEGNGSHTQDTVFSCSLTATPEPSTIALLGCGLFGLLAYAWRKRK